MSIERWTLITLLVLPVGLTFAQPSETKRVEPQKAVLADSQEPSTRLTLAPGLRATLWAAEPQLANPVALSFDAQGRLYVAETYRYGTSTLDVDDHPGLFDRDLALRTTEERSALLQEMFGDQAGRLAGESERVRLVEDTDGDGKADRSRIFAEGFNGPFDGVAGGILAERNQVWFASNPS